CSAHSETRSNSVISIKDRLFVFLHILVVSEREAFQSCQQRQQIAKHASGFTADEFHRVGILFLRHQARTRCDRIAQFENSKLSSSVNDDVLGESREMDHDQRTRTQKLDAEITIADCIETVTRNGCETQ